MRLKRMFHASPHASCICNMFDLWCSSKSFSWKLSPSLTNTRTVPTKFSFLFLCGWLVQNPNSTSIFLFVTLSFSFFFFNIKTTVTFTQKISPDTAYEHWAASRTNLRDSPSSKIIVLIIWQSITKLTKLKFLESYMQSLPKWIRGYT